MSVHRALLSVYRAFNVCMHTHTCIHMHAHTCMYVYKYINVIIHEINMC